MGYNYTWSVALRFGDHKYCGLKLHHLESETLIQKIQYLLLLLMKQDTSKLIKIVVGSTISSDFKKIRHRNKTQQHTSTTNSVRKRFIHHGTNSYSLFFFNNNQEISRIQIISTSYLTIQYYHPQRRENSHN